MLGQVPPAVNEVGYLDAPRSYLLGRVRAEAGTSREADTAGSSPESADPCRRWSPALMTGNRLGVSKGICRWKLGLLVSGCVHPTAWGRRQMRHLHSARHSGVIRCQLYGKGRTNPVLRASANASAREDVAVFSRMFWM